MIPLQKNRGLDDLTYHLIPGKAPPGFAAIDLHNRAYSYWKNFWAEVYTSAGAADAFNPDDFTRQDLIAVISAENQIVGMHLYTLFNLDQTSNREHRYFKFYPPEFFHFMNRNNANHAMSIEYLTVDPTWRKSLTGLPLGEILIGCSLRLLKHLHADAAIAPARTDFKVNQMTYKFGFDCFQAGVVKRNFEVDLVSGFKNRLRPHPDSSVESKIVHLWNSRKDHSGKTLSPIPDVYAA